MYDGPEENNDSFTDVLRYNFSDPNLTSASRYGEGITVTGYQDRSNFTTPPFAPADLILLTDGICSSTCALFVEMMTIQAGVKAITLGGRPQNGPMQPVGGTKGSSVLDSEYLTTFAGYLLSQFAADASEARAWAAVLPEPFPIRAYDASVNFLDNIRQGDQGVTPTQFTNETANCRLWYTPAMATDPMQLWSVVADAAWGGAEGGIDEARCVPGSYRKGTLLEDPPASTTSQGGSSSATGGGKANAAAAAAAATLDVRWALVSVLAVVVGVALS